MFLPAAGEGMERPALPFLVPPNRAGPPAVLTGFPPPRLPASTHQPTLWPPQTWIFPLPFA